MDNFREFQGNDLDSCVKQALHYFDCPREKLEVEIIQDAKNGIFGIVGARKAKIRARRAMLNEAVASILGQEGKNARPQTGAKTPGLPDKDSGKTGHCHKNQMEKNARVQDKGAPAPKTAAAQSQKKQEKTSNIRPDIDMAREKAAKTKTDAELAAAEADSYGEDSFAPVPIEELDQDLLAQNAKEIVANLVRPIVGDDFELTLDFTSTRARVHISGDWENGLLIGREGQTLIALEYLASRMLSRAMRAPLKLHLDIGDYRAKQDEKLREMARGIAERALETGRPISTRPLSSYHRRVIHLALQDRPDVTTRSSGEGPLKRVLVCPKRPCPPSRP